VLANPRIRVLNKATIVAENDDWGSVNPTTLAAAAVRIGGFALSSGSTDASLLVTLPPGVYTAQVTGGEGVALAEIYDASENPQADEQRLVNISSRGDVSTGDNILIGGFVITGNSPKRVMIRGIGPGLAAHGVESPLADPLLRVYHRDIVIAENDNWSADAATALTLTAAATETGAFSLASASKDAAILLNLAPGIYSVHVVGNGSSTGVALVEIYELPE
jgi:hypothetical protein